MLGGDSSSSLSSASSNLSYRKNTNGTRSTSATTFSLSSVSSSSSSVSSSTQRQRQPVVVVPPPPTRPSSFSSSNSPPPPPRVASLSSSASELSSGSPSTLSSSSSSSTSDSSSSSIMMNESRISRSSNPKHHHVRKENHTRYTNDGLGNDQYDGDDRSASSIGYENNSNAVIDMEEDENDGPSTPRLSNCNHRKKKDNSLCVRSSTYHLTHPTLSYRSSPRLKKNRQQEQQTQQQNQNRIVIGQGTSDDDGCDSSSNDHGDVSSLMQQHKRIYHSPIHSTTSACGGSPSERLSTASTTITKNNPHFCSPGNGSNAIFKNRGASSLFSLPLSPFASSKQRPRTGSSILHHSKISQKKHSHHKNGRKLIPMVLGCVIVVLSCVPFVSFHMISLLSNKSLVLNEEQAVSTLKRSNTRSAQSVTNMMGMETTGTAGTLKQQREHHMMELLDRVENNLQLSRNHQQQYHNMNQGEGGQDVSVQTPSNIAAAQSTLSHQTKQRASQAHDPFVDPTSGKAAKSQTASVSNAAAVATAHLDTSLPFIHILNTRFMQHQGNLTHLAHARLELFKTFCYPTIVQQTIQLEADHKYRQSKLRLQRQLSHDSTMTNSTITTIDGRSSNNNNNSSTPLASSSTPYPFMWIIKTDPDLDPNVRNELIELLRPHPNFFLIGSNNNFAASYGTGIEPGSWRGGHAGLDALNETHIVYVPEANSSALAGKGQRDMIKRAHLLRNDKITIETRVDADDGLPLDYLEAVQRRAVKYLSTNPNELYHTRETAPSFGEWLQQLRDHETHDGGADDDDQVTTNAKLEEIQQSHTPSNGFSKAKWMFWCIPHSISWHPSILENGFNPFGAQKNPQAAQENGENDYDLEGDAGRLVLDTNKGKKICMTPGLTVGMSVGTNDTTVPVESHYDLLHVFSRYRGSTKYNCGLSKSAKSCIDVLETKRAVRSRTPTSAGLKGVSISSQNHNTTEMELQWLYMDAVFGIPRALAVQVNSYLTENLVGILQDNLAGQCTLGHSCKEKARIHLQHMIDAAQTHLYNTTHHEHVGNLLRNDSA